MVSEEDVISSPQNSERPVQKSGQVLHNSNAHGERKDSLPLFSPRFRSVAAMAGWDEEALMTATLVVEDTPDRQLAKQKKRPDNVHNFKTPPTNSRRKRRAQRSPTSMPVVILDLEDDAHVQPPKESEKHIPVSKEEEREERKEEEKKSSEKGNDDQDSNASSSSSSAIPCMDRLREELSCAICLDICFEPSTTPCGHSFCKKCLRSAADKCGKKCPKCRQLISNGRSCTVNTVLWNTIQLLFPQEIEARKASNASKKGLVQQHQNPVRSNRVRVRSRNVPELSREAETVNGSPSRRRSSHGTGGQSYRPSRTLRRRNELPSQDEDAALALRLQREEFMGYRGSSDQEYTSSLALARANLRAMASRAIRGL